MWKVLAKVGCLMAAGAQMLSLGQQHNEMGNFPMWAGRMELTGNHFEKTVQKASCRAGPQQKEIGIYTIGYGN